MGLIEIVLAALFGVFAYLKLDDHPTIGKWSWWRVASPLWLYALLGLIFYVVVAGVIIGTSAFVGH